MKFGVHLPIIALRDDEPFSLAALIELARHVEQLDFAALATTDHLLYTRPFLDGLVALSAVVASTDRISLMTSIALPVVRGPVALSKALTAIDILSGGRLVAGVSTGSRADDYQASGIPFEERWKRLEEAVQVMRTLWQPGAVPFAGRYYSTVGLAPLPYPTRQPMPPIWIGSWGADSGLRRAARFGDGWLASAYNTTPAAFAEAHTRLEQYLRDAGKDAATFPNAISTMFFYISDDRLTIDRLLDDVLSPTFHRPGDELRARFLVGSAEQCATLLTAYHHAGAQQVNLWPAADPLHQLDLFRERVLTLLSTA